MSAASRRPGLPALLMLILLSVLPCLPALHGDFIWDDVSIYIVNNDLLRAPDGLYRFWLTNDPPDYYPLTYSTFWVEWQLVGNSPLLYHVDNILLHALTVAMVWLTLAELRMPGAWIAAAIFAVHPLNVESVAWISQRKSLLAAAFGFMATWQYLRQQRTPGRKSAAGMSLAFFLSLGAKPTLITLPVILAGYELLIRKASPRDAIVRTLPFWIMSLIFGLVGVLYQQKLIGGLDVRGQNLIERLLTMGWVLGFYVIKTVVPWKLTFVYPRWDVSAANPLHYLPNLGWIAIFVVCWMKRKSWGLAWLGGLGFYVLSLFPALGLIDVFYWRYSYVADHYVYQSLPAVIALLVWSLSRIDPAKLPLSQAKLVPPATAITCGILLVTSVRYASAFAGPEVIWRDTLAKNPHALLARNNLAAHLYSRGETHTAIEYFEQVIERDPTWFEAHRYLGHIYENRGDDRLSVEHFRQALEYAPGMSLDAGLTHVSLGGVLLRNGIVREGLQHLESGLKILEGLIRPGQPPTGELVRIYSGRYLLGVAAEQLGYDEEAESYFASARDFTKDDAAAHYELGTTMERVGQLGVAAEMLEQACTVKPENLQYRASLGGVLAQLGRHDEAIEHLQSVLDENSQLPDVHSNLGIALASRGEDEQAIRHFEAAVALAPNETRFVANLARAQAQSGQWHAAAANLREAHRQMPDMPAIARELSWLLATCPDRNVREPNESLRIGTELCRQTGWQVPILLDTLAAAYAANGDFEDAVRLTERALELTREQGPPDLADDLQRRLELYRSGRPYLQPAERRDG
ncbi:photosystem I assembly protein Ycf3 [Maioricimonas rarisocia]|uniref:Photosystem I assembly protein Ycf3 n=1 Tax=Maioricimonas rarisocia TaxID=2528026 RepID=A0A517ZDN9_9PLAN|nr:tetratricopeptide repeat protein [Maioricimonas rarisocia]QDU40586.1 photosystem I assembly protein Ycf3 [Maioricimonas rarisocia]